MPELPEVEIMTRNLARWVEGRRIVDVQLSDARIDRGGVARWAAGCRRSPPTVLRVSRRAKYTVVELGSSQPSAVLLLHYRMTGRVVAEAPGQRKGQRLVFVLEPRLGHPDHVVFDDPRRLGTAEVLRVADFAVWRRESPQRGPEPWPTPREAAFWRARLGSARGAIKPALMDQGRVAGLGNIAASEILWRARIHPAAVPGTLDDRDWARLADAVPRFIEDTLERESGDEIAYVNSRGGSARGISSPFEVYRCDGQPCPRCATPVEVFRQSGRSTYWCPSCQAAS